MCRLNLKLFLPMQVNTNLARKLKLKDPEEVLEQVPRAVETSLSLITCFCNLNFVNL